MWQLLQYSLEYNWEHSEVTVTARWTDVVDKKIMPQAKAKGHTAPLEKSAPALKTAVLFLGFLI